MTTQTTSEWKTCFACDAQYVGEVCLKCQEEMSKRAAVERDGVPLFWSVALGCYVTTPDSEK